MNDQLPRTLDSGYLGTEAFTATYLLREGPRALFVETATAHTVPKMLAALADEGLSPADVEFIIITHVHLDHAGGASLLMKSCPNATLLAHPRAIRHVIDPSKLVLSASAVYGPERFRELYGEIEPIPTSRVRAMEHGETLRFGTRQLTFLHTRGHANHHFVIHDSGSNGVFTGDAFGLVYPALQTKGLLALPSTSPTDFDPEAAKKSVQEIVATGAERVYLTHFGAFTEVHAIAAQLAQQLELHGDLMTEAAATTLSGPALIEFCRPRVTRFFADARSRVGLQNSTLADQLLATDLELNAQGIAFAAERARQA